MEEAFSQNIWEFCQSYLDKLQSYKGSRWGFLITIICLYLLRVSIIGEYYLVTYVIVSSMLKQVHVDDEIVDDIVDAPVLHVNFPGELKPFIWKIHEFNLWRNCTVAMIIGGSCTFFDVFNIDIFWPLLVVDNTTFSFSE